jgi:hypothetical protein
MTPLSLRLNEWPGVRAFLCDATWYLALPNLGRCSILGALNLPLGGVFAAI